MTAKVSSISPGRFTADIEGSFVVFIIGMRINRLMAFHKWVPVAQAMGPMVRQLMTHKELGLQGEPAVPSHGNPQQPPI